MCIQTDIISVKCCRLAFPFRDQSVQRTVWSRLGWGAGASSRASRKFSSRVFGWLQEVLSESRSDSGEFSFRALRGNSTRFSLRVLRWLQKVLLFRVLSLTQDGSFSESWGDSRRFSFRVLGWWTSARVLTDRQTQRQREREGDRWGLF